MEAHRTFDNAVHSPTCAVERSFAPLRSVHKLLTIQYSCHCIGRLCHFSFNPFYSHNLETPGDELVKFTVCKGLTLHSRYLERGTVTSYRHGQDRTCCPECEPSRRSRHSGKHSISADPGTISVFCPFAEGKDENGSVPAGDELLGILSSGAVGEQRMKCRWNSQSARTVGSPAG